MQNVGPVVVRDGKYRFVRTAPILFSPADPHVLFFATQRPLQDDQRRPELGDDQPRSDARSLDVPSSLGIYAADAANAGSIAA